MILVRLLYPKGYLSFPGVYKNITIRITPTNAIHIHQAIDNHVPTHTIVMLQTTPLLPNISAQYADHSIPHILYNASLILRLDRRNFSELLYFPLCLDLLLSKPIAMQAVWHPLR
jgi:hypothetical protein